MEKLRDDIAEWLINSTPFEEDEKFVDMAGLLIEFLQDRGWKFSPLSP